MRNGEFSQATRENRSRRREGRSEARKRIDGLRVKLWYRFIATASGAGQYALEKQLIPQGFARDESGAQIHHRNRMAGYAKGRHVPGKSFVQRVEQAYPGSSGMLNHSLWQMLDPQSDLDEFRMDGVRHLGMGVRDILCRASSFYGAENVALRLAQLRKLERDGSLEAAGAVAYLLREAVATMDSAFAFACARSFWKLLLLLGVLPTVAHHLQELTDLCGALLLDQVEIDGERVAIEGAPVAKLNVLLNAVCDEPCRIIASPQALKSTVRNRLEFMSFGKRRLEYFVALSMPTAPGTSCSEGSATYRRCVKDQLARKMAYRYITEPRYIPCSFSEDYQAFADREYRCWPSP